MPDSPPGDAPMDDMARAFKPWLTFAGLVLVAFVLFWARAVLVPTALAALFAFVLSPPVTWLERRLGRVAAVLVTVALVFSAVAFASWGLVRQVDHLVQRLPDYRSNILAKIADVRGAGTGGSVAKLEETVQDIKTKLSESDPSKPATPAPAPGPSESTPGGPGPEWIGSFVGPLGTAGLVLTLVIFMLLERRELRDRFIGLIGHGQLARTTKALDEAGSRVSRQLLMQSLVNLLYGLAIAVGLYLLDVPYALAWGGLAAALRLIPYVGSFMAAAGPIIVSVAALPGWGGTLSVAVLFVAVELFTSFVFETRIYAGAAGVSPVALLLSVAFWTWLWGPLGLLMATPLTVCLVVMGKHVPGLEFLGVLMADAPALAPQDGFYQRLLARDMAEAAELVDRHVKSIPPRSVFDALLLPALYYAERDRLEERLSLDDQSDLVEAARELTSYAADAIGRQPSPSASTSATSVPAGADPLRVLGFAHNDVSDAALGMLAQVLDNTPVALERTSARLLASELVAAVQTQRIPIVCFADVPPSPPAKTLYFIKRLRAASPDVIIVVGRWAPASLVDDTAQGLRDAGATLVTSTLEATRTYLCEAASRPKPALHHQE